MYTKFIQRMNLAQALIPSSTVTGKTLGEHHKASFYVHLLSKL